MGKKTNKFGWQPGTDFVRDVANKTQSTGTEAVKYFVKQIHPGNVGQSEFKKRVS